MDSTISQPSESRTATASKIQRQTSGSVQSHLSATTSQQRFRNISPLALPLMEKELSSDTDDLEANDTTVFLGSSLPGDRWSYACFPAEIQFFVRRLPQKRWLRWLILGYCGLCVVFLTATLSSMIQGKSWVRMGDFASQGTPKHEISHLEALPMDYLISKTTAIYPPPVELSPYAFKGRSNADSVTACLWVKSDDIGAIAAWVTRWTGQVSVIVTTFDHPSSPEHPRLLRKLQSIHGSQQLRDTSIHLLHLEPGTPENPNAYLNLARLFSPTPRIVLFPGNASVIPPKMFYRSFSSDASSRATNASIHKPTIFTSRGHTAYPFSALSPVVLNRDDPLWCTERFFPPMSRESDWSECLWQFWLESFGDLDTKQTSDWVNAISIPPNPNSVAARLHRRLSARYRSETCMLATRQLTALRASDRGGEGAKKGRWLKRHCREWMTLA